MKLTGMDPMRYTGTALLATASLLLVAACGGGDDDVASDDDMATETTMAQPAGERDDAAGMSDDTAPAMPSSSMDEADDEMEMASGAGDEGADEGMMDTASAGTTASDDQGTSDVAATGTVHEVQMLNADPDNPSERMVFVPDLVLAQPGDTIRFVPTDPSHQSSSIDGMIPDGTEGWRGEINKAVEYVVPEPGVYGFKCVPHYAAGMVGLVVVEGEGMMDNVEEAKEVRQIGLAQRRFEDIWNRAEEQYLNTDS